VTDFANDPDFRLRWPNHIFAAELRRLIGRGRTTGITTEWREEVEQLLQQSFTSSVPVREFRRSEKSLQDWDEDPF